MAGQEVVQRTPSQELILQVRGEKFMEQVGMALPGNVTPARFVRAAITAVMQNHELAETDADSLFSSLIKCATDGLLPDGREAALVIFNTKVKTPTGDVWVKKAQYMPMVGGFRKIAAEHGWTIRSAVVYANDEFNYELGEEPKLTHRPAPLRTERGDKIAAYAVASHKDGRREFEVMTDEEIQKVRKVSRAADRGPWVDWEERMWEKTPARRLFAKLPLDRSEDSRIASILKSENAADLLYGPDGTPHKVTPALSPSPADAPTVAAPQEGADAATPPGDDQAPGNGEGDQQVGAAETPAAAPTPDPDEDQEPEVGGSFEIPEAAVNDAAATVVPKGVASVKGKALSEIAAEEDGDHWLAWALRKKPPYWPAPFRAALETFVEHRVPEVWSEYQASLGEAA